MDIACGVGFEWIAAGGIGLSAAPAADVPVLAFAAFALEVVPVRELCEDIAFFMNVSQVC